MPIPTTTLTPFIYIDFKASTRDLGPTLQTYRALLIGQLLVTGTVLELIPTKITSAADASIFFGSGSILHRMAIGWFANNRATEVWAVGQDDAAAAAPATGTFTITGAASANGTLYVYVGGVRFAVGVIDLDDATAMGDAVAAAINADVDLPVTAVNAVGVVTCTAKNGGTLGNSIDLRMNNAQGEFVPAGVTVVVVGMASGATDPDITDVWPAIAGTQYHVMGVGVNDQQTLTDVHAELDARFDPAAAIDGYAFFSTSDTLGNSVTLGIANNSEHETILPIDGCPTPPFEVAAVLAAIAAFDGERDPARPFTTVELKGVLAPNRGLLFDLFERESLAIVGMSTFEAGVTGTMHVNRLITTRTKTDLGILDPSFRPLEARLSLSYIRFDARNRMSLRFARHKLANDGQVFDPGQDIATPSIIRDELIAMAMTWVAIGLIENIEAFKAGIVVTRHATNRDRVDVLMPIDMINQFLVGAFTVEFQL